ncbi:MAG: hypothetical protein V3U96_10620 [Paracoccaceae bacterium]
MTLKKPIYVAKSGYRLRRAIDAARLLPIAGIFFIVLPLLWNGGQTRYGIVYIFAVWFALIVISALLSKPLSIVDAQSREPENGSV